MKGLTALGRYAEADEIAGLVAYLAGREAAFVTGASLTRRLRGLISQAVGSSGTRGGARLTCCWGTVGD